jgi:hypothetical protein
MTSALYYIEMERPIKSFVSEHLSIYDFFLSNRCGYRVNVRDAHMQLGTSCLKTMVGQLRFNICKLEDSRLANADVTDLRIPS